MLLLVSKIYLPVLSPIGEAIAKKIDFTKLNFKIMAYATPNTILTGLKHTLMPLSQKLSDDLLDVKIVGGPLLFAPI